MPQWPAVTELLIVALYLAATTAFGAWIGRRGNVREYLLAGQDVPWWAVAACVVATETSTLTFIGVPAMAYTGNWAFLQLAAGFLLGRIIVAFVLVPAYFKGRLVTSYELLGQRFGSRVRAGAAVVFVVSRNVADGIRLHAAALVVAVTLGRPDLEWVAIVCLGGAMILYTEHGGARATIWTDVLQLFVYLLGVGVCIAVLASRLPDGVFGTLGAAATVGKLQVIDLSWDATVPLTLWAGLIGGVALTLATQGTDHYLVQRLLVARSQKDAAVGIVVSGVVVVAQFGIFLAFGTLLWAHYGGRAFARGDEIVPTFLAQDLGSAWSGLVLAAVIAAALSPSLNALASSTVRDFYLPFVAPGADEAHQMRVARRATVGWGLVQITCALVAQGVQSALDQGLAVLGHASGPTVGAFLLAALRPRTAPPHVALGMAAGLAVSLLLGRLAPWVWGTAPLAWTWNAAVGSSVTVATALALSLLRRRQ